MGIISKVLAAWLIASSANNLDKCDHDAGRWTRVKLSTYNLKSNRPFKNCKIYHCKTSAECYWYKLNTNEYKLPRIIKKVFYSNLYKHF